MSTTLKNCDTWGCTYYEQSPGSRKCRSCAMGIKRPLAGGAGAPGGRTWLLAGTSGGALALLVLIAISAVVSYEPTT